MKKTTIRRATRLSMLCALPCLIGCGGGGTAPGGGGGSGAGSMRATIDGQPWVADASAVQVTADASAPGVLGIIGTHVASASNYLSVQLALGYLTGPKTYPLGVNAGTNAGGSATVFDSQSSGVGIWATDLAGDRGSVTVTSMAAGRFAGTFQFTAPPQLGSSVTTTRTITDGSFDLPLPAAFQAPAADDYGSFIMATINGQPWNGATVTGLGDTSAGALSFGASTTGYLLSFTTSTPVQAGMTYDQTALQVTASNLGASGMNWGGGGSVVSVSVSSLTAKRIAGTFTATLAGIPSSLPPLSITGGAFDVRIDPAR